VARLRPFRLPGGEAAVREPRRVAAALLWELEGEAGIERGLPALAGFGAGERRALGHLLATGLRAPLTSSMGRLFDGVAALAGLGARVSFEGEAAMALEHAADPDERGAYPFELARTPAPAGLAPGQEPADELVELDWRPLLAALLADLARGAGAAAIAARFHNALAEAAVALAAAAGLATVVLTGGCFQNRRLAESAAARLRAAGFEPWLPSAAPVNDGGVALGQIAVAAARLAAKQGA
jgi:hydrogenase maturation protein HypF